MLHYTTTIYTARAYIVFICRLEHMAFMATICQWYKFIEIQEEMNGKDIFLCILADKHNCTNITLE